MQFIIDGEKYDYVANAIKDDNTRDSYFNLAKQVFGLNFYIWYNSGFYGNSFIPYALFHNGNAVSSVGIAISDMKWQNHIKKCVQISTVMTDSNFRGKGLSKKLMELVISEWKDKCDSLYLYANDSVVDFYPKFGFEKTVQYSFHQQIEKLDGIVRKLDLSSQRDIDLLVEKYMLSNPFSKLTMENNLDFLMFHCFTFLRENIFYVEKYDAIVIASYENENLFCYDVYMDSHYELMDVIGILATENTKTLTLGFTPKYSDTYIAEKSKEKDTTVFVLNGTENLFENKVTFPFLSRA